MRVLVLRPAPDAQRSAGALGAAGHHATIAPLFAVQPTGAMPPDGGCDAILISSANAVAPLRAGARDGWIDLPLLAVGERSAEAATAAGFTRVRSAGGNRDDLIRLAADTLAPGTRLLLVLGEDHKPDLVPRLEAAGFVPAVWIAYRMAAVTTLPPEAAAVLRDGDVDAVLHYSLRGAQTFVDLSRAAGLLPAARDLAHVVLSPDIAAALEAAGAVRVTAAHQPDEAALILGLAGISARNRAGSGDNLSMETGAGAERNAAPSVGDNMSPADDNPHGDTPRRPASAGRGRTRVRPDVIEGDVIAATGPESGPLPAEKPETASPEPVLAAAAAPEPQADIPPDGATGPLTPAGRRFGLPAVLAAAVFGGVCGTVLSLALPYLVPHLNPAAGAAAAIDRRLAQLQAGAVPKQAVENLEGRIAALATQATRTETEAAATSKRLAEALAAAPAVADGAALTALTERAGRAEAAATTATRQLGEIAARLSTIETHAKNPAIASPAALGAARLVLSDRIGRALEDGTPFAADLKALAASGIAATGLAPLSVVAAEGAASRDGLREAFRRLRPVLEQDTAAQPVSLGDRTLKLLEGVVSVRPIGEQAGTSPAAIASRLDRALASRDFAGAATAWGRLPEPARRASQDFGARLAARAAADTAIRQIGEEAVTALAAAK